MTGMARRPADALDVLMDAEKQLHTCLDRVAKMPRLYTADT